MTVRWLAVANLGALCWRIVYVDLNLISDGSTEMLDPKYFMYDESSDLEVSESGESVQEEVGCVSVRSLSVANVNMQEELELETELMAGYPGPTSANDSILELPLSDTSLLSPSINSVSSLSSSRRLEWDSGADLGYAEKTPAGISTIERMVLGSSASLHCSTTALSESSTSVQISRLNHHLSYSSPARQPSQLSKLMWRLSFEESLAEPEEKSPPRPSLAPSSLAALKSHSLDSLSVYKTRQSFQNQPRSYSQDFRPDAMIPAQVQTGTVASSSGSQATVVYNSPSRKLDFSDKIPDSYSCHSEDNGSPESDEPIIPIMTHRSSSTDRQDAQVQNLDSKSSDFVYYPGHTLPAQPSSHPPTVSLERDERDASAEPRTGTTSTTTSSTRRSDIAGELRFHRQLRDHLQCLNAYLHRLERTYKLSAHPDLERQASLPAGKENEEHESSLMSRSSKSSIARLPDRLHISEPDKPEVPRSKSTQVVHNTYVKAPATTQVIEKEKPEATKSKVTQGNHNTDVKAFRTLRPRSDFSQSKKENETGSKSRVQPSGKFCPKLVSSSAPATLISKKRSTERTMNKQPSFEKVSSKTSVSGPKGAGNTQQPSVPSLTKKKRPVGMQGCPVAGNKTTAVQTTDSLLRNSTGLGDVPPTNFVKRQAESFRVCWNSEERVKPVPTLQAALRSTRPDFIARAEARSKFLRFSHDMRLLQSELRRETVARLPANARLPSSLSPLSLPRLFTTQELKEQNAKWVRKSNPVQTRLYEMKKKQTLQTNQAMAKIYQKKLQHQVLKGHVTMNHNTSVLAL